MPPQATHWSKHSCAQSSGDPVLLELVPPAPPSSGVLPPVAPTPPLVVVSVLAPPLPVPPTEVELADPVVLASAPVVALELLLELAVVDVDATGVSGFSLAHP